LLLLDHPDATTTLPDDDGGQHHRKGGDEGVGGEGGEGGDEKLDPDATTTLPVPLLPVPTSPRSTTASSSSSSIHNSFGVAPSETARCFGSCGCCLLLSTHSHGESCRHHSARPEHSPLFSQEDDDVPLAQLRERQRRQPADDHDDVCHMCQMSRGFLLMPVRNGPFRRGSRCQRQNLH
jgi:hypothetical protein